VLILDAPPCLPETDHSSVPVLSAANAKKNSSPGHITISPDGSVSMPADDTINPSSSSNSSSNRHGHDEPVYSSTSHLFTPIHRLIVNTELKKTLHLTNSPGVPDNQSKSLDMSASWMKVMTSSDIDNISLLINADLDVPFITTNTIDHAHGNHENMKVNAESTGLTIHRGSLPYSPCVNYNCIEKHSNALQNAVNRIPNSPPRCLHEKSNMKSIGEQDTDAISTAFSRISSSSLQCLSSDSRSRWNHPNLNYVAVRDVCYVGQQYSYPADMTLFHYAHDKQTLHEGVQRMNQ
jgi:hypothetical protein